MPNSESRTPNAGIVCGDARRIPLPNASVQCVVTSPPYWNLRDYGLVPSIWYPSRARQQAVACAHEWGEKIDPGAKSNRDTFSKYRKEGDMRGGNKSAGGTVSQGQFCQRCGAWRGVLGLEPATELYVRHIVEIFREVRRVLRPDGTLWLNLGDSYAAGGRGSSEHHIEKMGAATARGQAVGRKVAPEGLKPKDLVGIPWRVAFALQADGWWLRSDIIWSKPNPMPESVTDRPTKSHEYIFLLAKSERYLFNQDAVCEPVTASTIERLSQPTLAEQAGSDRVPGKTNGNMKAVPPRFGGSKYGDSEAAQDRTKSGNDYELRDGKRNIRTVWDIATQPYSGAHFATFPEAIPERCIKAGSRPGDLVLDPFGATGTVGRVAERLNRRWVCLDLKYHDLAAKRTTGIQKDLLLSP